MHLFVLELESQLKSKTIDSLDIKRELAPSNGDAACRISELEKALKILRQEKDEAVKDKVDAFEKMKLQDKELKDALSQRKLAMTEYTEVTDKLSELRQQKQKLSRQVCFHSNYFAKHNCNISRYK